MLVLNTAELFHYFSTHDTNIIKKNCEGGEESEVVGRTWSVGGGGEGARPHTDLVACGC